MLRPPKYSKNTLLRALIFVSAAILLFVAIPGEEGQRYDYGIGKLWNYDAIVTSVDVPIFNEPERQQQIEDSIVRSHNPIYYRNSETGTMAVDNYTRALLSNHTLALLPQKRNLLVATLKEIYSTGIIDSRGGTMPRMVRIRKSETDPGIPQPSDGFYTFASAHSKIQDAIGPDTMLHRVLSAIMPEIRPNILYDSVMNQRYLENAKSFAHAAIGMVPGGTKIVDRGDVVTPRIYSILKTYEEKIEQNHKETTSTRLLSDLGQLAVILICLTLLYAYIAFFRPDYWADVRYLGLLTFVMTGFALFALIMNLSFDRGIYIVPFTIVPILLLVFMDSRSAFFAYMLTILLTAVLTHYMLDFILMQFAAGFVALVSIRELSKRSQLLRAAVLVLLTYSIVYAAVTLMQTGSIDRQESTMFGALTINAVLISFAYILIFLIEKCFGFISRVTLVELSDINHPLLQELSQECPGTFQHSMAVSNMASAAAAKVKANVQLVRAGALYHDIGKVANPAFFTENQHGVNPHDTLSPLQSARIVIGHVSDGLRRAEKAKLPPKIKDFITQHHGKGKARYFYTTYCNQHPDEQVDEAPFTYPGPNPQTLEASILMMADSVEAASRSLKEHTPEAIDALVNRIIDTQVAEGLHNDSPISFRDINEIKKSFASTLRTMYHSRISYPESLRTKADDTTSEIQPGQQPDTKIKS